MSRGSRDAVVTTPSGTGSPRSSWARIATSSRRVRAATSSSLRSIHPELEDASRIFGATRLRALVDITAPLIRNGVIATWIFIFIGSIRELSATILLFTVKTKTVSVAMFDLRESNDWGPIAVLSITMLAITFLMVATITWFTDRRLT